ncbi:MAG: hypothetical protein ACRDNL_15025 [Spirillospora sp.]
MTAVAFRQPRWLQGLNGRGHQLGLNLFMFIVIAHWAEHIVQAIQIWALGWPVKESRGVFGQWFPWLVTSEAMHYSYALVMLVGLILLRPAFRGHGRTWWNISLGIQFWHHIEHLLLLIQAQTGSNIAGKPVPTSIIQLIIPRVELHLFYNGIVFVPMVIAMILHKRGDATGSHAGSATCTCATSRT